MRFIVIVLALAGCGDNTSPTPADERFSLSSSNAKLEGLVLLTSTILPVDRDQVGDTDVYLSTTMVIQLRGSNPEGAFCAKGQGVTQIADISADLGDCEWKFYAELGGNAPHASEFAGDAYVVRARQGAAYRLLVVDDFVDDAHVATVVFDVSPISRSVGR